MWERVPARGGPPADAACVWVSLLRKSADTACARPKSSTLARPSGVTDHVRALEIPVNDALFMGVRERVSDLDPVAQHRFERKAFAPDQLAQRTALRCTP